MNRQFISTRSVPRHSKMCVFFPKLHQLRYTFGACSFFFLMMFAEISVYIMPQVFYGKCCIQISKINNKYIELDPANFFTQFLPLLLFPSPMSFVHTGPMIPSIVQLGGPRLVDLLPFSPAEKLVRTKPIVYGNAIFQGYVECRVPMHKIRYFLLIGFAHLPTVFAFQMYLSWESSADLSYSLIQIFHLNLKMSISLNILPASS